MVGVAFTVSCKNEVKETIEAANTTAAEDRCANNNCTTASLPIGYAVAPLIPTGPFGSRVAIDITYDVFRSGSTLHAVIITATGVRDTLSAEVSRSQRFVTVTKNYANEAFPANLVAIYSKKGNCIRPAINVALPAVIN